MDIHGDHDVLGPVYGAGGVRGGDMSSGVSVGAPGPRLRSVNAWQAERQGYGTPAGGRGDQTPLGAEQHYAKAYGHGDLLAMQGVSHHVIPRGPGYAPSRAPPSHVAAPAAGAGRSDGARAYGTGGGAPPAYHSGAIDSQQEGRRGTGSAGRPGRAGASRTAAAAAAAMEAALATGVVGRIPEAPPGGLGPSDSLSARRGRADASVAPLYLRHAAPAPPLGHPHPHQPQAAGGGDRVAVDMRALSGALAEAREGTGEVRAALVRASFRPRLPGLTKLVSKLSKEGCWKKAIEVFETAEAIGLRPDTALTNAAISACDKGGRWQSAAELFERMGSLGLRRDAITYSATISAMAKGKQWRAAIGVFEHMAASGVQADVVTCCSLINALERSGQWQLGEKLFLTMCGGEDGRAALGRAALAVGLGADPAGSAGGGKAALTGAASGLGDATPVGTPSRAGDGAPAPPPPGGGAGALAPGTGPDQAPTPEPALPSYAPFEHAAGVRPNRVCCNALLSAYARARPPRWDRCVQLLAVMCSEDASLRPDVVSYNTAIKACGAARQPRVGCAILRAATAAGVRPNAATFSSLIAVAGEVGDAAGLQEVAGWLDLAEPEVIAANANALVTALVRAGCWDEALHRFRALEAEAGAGATPAAPRGGPIGSLRASVAQPTSAATASAVGPSTPSTAGGSSGAFASPAEVTLTSALFAPPPGPPARSPAAAPRGDAAAVGGAEAPPLRIPPGARAPPPPPSTADAGERSSLLASLLRDLRSLGPRAGAWGGSDYEGLLAAAVSAAGGEAAAGGAGGGGLDARTDGPGSRDAAARPPPPAPPCGAGLGFSLPREGPGPLASGQAGGLPTDGGRRCSGAAPTVPRDPGARAGGPASPSAMSPSAYSAVVEGHVERGAYDEARAAYRALLASGQLPPASATHACIHACLCSGDTVCSSVLLRAALDFPRGSPQALDSSSLEIVLTGLERAARAGCPRAARASSVDAADLYLRALTGGASVAPGEQCHRLLLRTLAAAEGGVPGESPRGLAGRLLAQIDARAAVPGDEVEAEAALRDAAIVAARAAIEGGRLPGGEATAEELAALQDAVRRGDVTETLALASPLLIARRATVPSWLVREATLLIASHGIVGPSTSLAACAIWCGDAAGTAAHALLERALARADTRWAAGLAQVLLVAGLELLPAELSALRELTLSSAGAAARDRGAPASARASPSAVPRASAFAFAEPPSPPAGAEPRGPPPAALSPDAEPQSPASFAPSPADGPTSPATSAQGHHRSPLTPLGAASVASSGAGSSSSGDLAAAHLLGPTGPWGSGAAVGSGKQAAGPAPELSRGTPAWPGAARAPEDADLSGLLSRYLCGRLALPLGERAPDMPARGLPLPGAGLTAPPRGGRRDAEAPWFDGYPGSRSAPGAATLPPLGSGTAVAGVAGVSKAPSFDVPSREDPEVREDEEGSAAGAAAAAAAESCLDTEAGKEPARHLPGRAGGSGDPRRCLAQSAEAGIEAALLLGRGELALSVAAEGAGAWLRDRVAHGSPGAERLDLSDAGPDLATALVLAWARVVSADPSPPGVAELSFSSPGSPAACAIQAMLCEGRLPISLRSAASAEPLPEGALKTLEGGRILALPSRQLVSALSPGPAAGAC